MTIFDARQYWPKPVLGKTLTNSFSSGIVHTYRTAADGSVCLTQTIKGKFDSDWYYVIDPYRGVLEYRDDYPKKWYNYLEVWKPKREVWCVPGKEIYWGGYSQIGTTLKVPCETSGILGQRGTQGLRFEAILPTYGTPAHMFMDVLVLTYWQQWGNGKIDGAKMWLAPGLGQIRAEWMENRMPSGYSMELQWATEEWE